jgi:AbrB family looped-hinge helix DNA binding protein
MSDLNANPHAKSRVSVDSGGRILLPKKIRQRLGLAAGDELDVEFPVFPVTGLDHAGEHAILLRVVRPEVPLRREGRFWVYRGGEAPVVDFT